ncbi:hypothetical protein AYI68_g887 [Smittium mucronatum]|uniref:Uncharacterized protein n=1 Tax=Smittium mucronatum TaxID=133383 RepID=A0A1R0H0R4_9FUNG|nr:hypothetical protein AYI68_g3148 [Smittium mucronatum]OLY84938.1 hypothetical protein AYI68_g887 [Smittium mucronatum]
MNMATERNPGDQIGSWLDQFESQVSEMAPLPRKQILTTSKPLSETKKLYLINKIRKRLGYERLEAVVITKTSPIEADINNNNGNISRSDDFIKPKIPKSQSDQDPSSTAAGVQPWYLSSAISSDLISIGNLSQIADRWNTLSSLSKLTVLFSLVGLGERKLFLVKEEVSRVAKLSINDSNTWVQLIGSMISTVGLNGKMSGLTADLNNPQNTLDPKHKLMLDEAVEKLVAIAQSSPFKFIPREWCYLGTEIRQSLAPKCTIGSYSGERVTPSPHSLEDHSPPGPDNWGLKINFKKDRLINHQKRLDTLQSAMKSATGGLRHRIGTVKPGGFRGNSNTAASSTSGPRVKSPSLSVLVGEKTSAIATSNNWGLRPNDHSQPKQIQQNQSEIISPKDSQSPETPSGTFVSSNLNTSTSSIRGNLQTPGLGLALGHGPNRPTVSGFGAVSAIMNNRPKNQQPPGRSLNQPKNKLGLLTGKKRPFSSANASPAFGVLGTTPVRRRTAEDISNIGVASKIESPSVDAGLDASAGLSGLHRKTRIQFVDMEDSAVLMQEREVVKKEQRDKVAEEREAKKVKRREAIEKRRSSASNNKNSGSESEGLDVELEDGDEDEDESNVENGPKDKTSSEGDIDDSYVPEKLEDGSSDASKRRRSTRSNGLPSYKLQNPDDEHQNNSELAYAPNIHESDENGVNDLNKKLPASQSDSDKSPSISGESSKIDFTNPESGPLASNKDSNVKKPASSGSTRESKRRKTSSNIAVKEPEKEVEPDLPDPEIIERIFKDANVVSNKDRQRIIDFLHGKPSAFENNETNPIDIVLQKVELPDPSDTNRLLVEQILFQINVESGEWKMYKRRIKASK